MKELLLVIYSLFPAVVTLPTGDHFLSGKSVPTTEPTVVKEMIIHPLKNRKSGANFLRYTCLPNLQAASTDRLLVIFWTDGCLKKAVFFSPQLHLDLSGTQRPGFVPKPSSEER